MPISPKKIRFRSMSPTRRLRRASAPRLAGHPLWQRPRPARQRLDIASYCPADLLFIPCRYGKNTSFFRIWVHSSRMTSGAFPS